MWSEEGLYLGRDGEDLYTLRSWRSDAGSVDLTAHAAGAVDIAGERTCVCAVAVTAKPSSRHPGLVATTGAGGLGRFLL
jgi:hypothetical protein